MFCKFAFISVSRNISNGMGMGLSAIYTNVNGVERGMASLHPIPPPLYLLDESLDEEISDYKQNTERNFKALNNVHKRTLQRTQSEFLDIKKHLKKKNNENNDKLDKLRRQKEKELKELEKSVNNDDFDKASLYDTYMQTESRKINQKFDKMRNKIDKKYKFTKPKLVMEESDKERMENYKKEIRRLNTFSNAPNFRKVINEFKLDNYV